MNSSLLFNNNPRSLKNGMESRSVCPFQEDAEHTRECTTSPSTYDPKRNRIDIGTRIEFMSGKYDLMFEIMISSIISLQIANPILSI